jgi:hypothetical protein
MLNTLTIAGLAFRPIPAGHDQQRGVRCALCRGRIAGRAAYDATNRPFHVECLTRARRVGEGKA